MDNNSTIVQSPLKEYLLSKGFSSNGSGTINYFSSKEEEVNILYEGVGLRDISTLGILELKGKDVLDFIHRISTNSTKDLPKEKIAHTIFTTEKGRIIDVTSLFNFDDYKLLFCSEENKKKVKSWLNRYVITDDVNCQVLENKVVLELLGPQAESFATLICGNLINELESNSFKVISSEGMLFFIAKLPSKNGKDKFWLLADKENGEALVNFMLDNKGPFNFGLIGKEAYEEYRIEKGILKAPNELNDNYNPHDLGLIGLVDFKKGCYIGQEVIARLDTYDKVKHSLTGICFDEKIEDTSDIIIYHDDKEAGAVTSVTDSIKCKKMIGLAVIRKALNENGLKVTAKEKSGRKIQAQIHHLPLKK